MMREQLFWLIDRLRGSDTAEHLSSIKKILGENTSESAVDYQQSKLQTLIRHAGQTTVYYKGANEFFQLPVINKNIIRENPWQFRSSAFAEKELHRVTTSGSTGTPFEVFQDKGKRTRQAAENIYFNDRCGFKIGDRLYFLRIWNKINQLSWAHKQIKNIVPVEASDLSAEKVQLMIKTIQEDKSRKSLLAYATTYEGMAFQLEKLKLAKLEGEVGCCISMSEALDEDTRLKLQAFFGCGVFARYSNSENGFIAHQLPNFGSDYLINSASFVVELLELESDKHVEEGNPGRIVVTDLFNYAMPMLRYDTGDVGVTGYHVDDVGRKHMVLKTILGRKLDFIRGANDSLISPHVIDYALRRYPGLRQFQIVQLKPFEFKLKLNLEKGFSVDENQVRESLFVYLDKRSIIRFEYVDEIPLLASGKRKIVVSLIGNV